MAGAPFRCQAATRASPLFAPLGCPLNAQMDCRVVEQVPQRDRAQRGTEFDLMVRLPLRAPGRFRPWPVDVPAHHTAGGVPCGASVKGTAPGTALNEVRAKSVATFSKAATCRGSFPLRTAIALVE